jgi:carbon-monoxide dehydrogenase small subunit
MADIAIGLELNGKWVRCEVDPAKSLLHFLREDMGLTGTREGCGHGDCGSCTVLLDGKPVLSCIMYAFQATGRSIVTIEGLGDGELSVIQQCFVEKGAIQCGFCTPAMILAGKALLDENPSPTRDEIREAISGVLCRCTGYRKIVDAIQEAAIRQTGGR